MHFKKTILLSTFLLLSGCSERNTEYYTAHIDEAEVKAKECEALMGEAFKSKNKEQLEEISKDPECNSAVDVVRKHKQNLAKIKLELKQKELERLKKEEEKKYNEEYSNYLTSLQKLNYKEIYTSYQKCKLNYKMSKTAKCKALNEVSELKQAEEIQNLKVKYVDGKLEEFRKKSCKGLSFNDVDCATSKQAESQQQKEKINYYLSHRDDLKKDFNECHNKFKSLKKAKKWQEANESTRTYQCSMVGKAASKLKIYSFNKPIA